MKKKTLALLALLATVSMTACGNSTVPAESKSTDVSKEAQTLASQESSVETESVSETVSESSEAESSALESSETESSETESLVVESSVAEASEAESSATATRQNNLTPITDWMGANGQYSGKTSDGHDATIEISCYTDSTDGRGGIVTLSIPELQYTKQCEFTVPKVANEIVFTCDNANVKITVYQEKTAILSSGAGADQNLTSMCVTYDKLDISYDEYG